jgi:hypothetical protein
MRQNLVENSPPTVQVEEEVYTEGFLPQTSHNRRRPLPPRILGCPRAAAALCGDKTKSEESSRRMGGKRIH